MTALPSDLLTRKEAADLLSLSVSSMYQHQRSGALNRANEGSNGTPVLYRRSDIEAFRLKLKRNQRIIRLSATHQTCTRCNQCLSVDKFSFYRNKSGNISRAAICKNCNTSRTKNYCEKHKAHFKNYYANYRKFYRGITSSIQDGKTSPICKTKGFVIAATNKLGEPTAYRAARLDKPLSPGENALVRYEYHYSVWCVLPVPVRVPDSDRVTGWCQRYEARQKSKDGRLKKNMKKAGVS